MVVENDGFLACSLLIPCLRVVHIESGYCEQKNNPLLRVG